MDQSSENNVEENATSENPRMADESSDDVAGKPSQQVKKRKSIGSKISKWVKNKFLNA